MKPQKARRPPQNNPELRIRNVPTEAIQLDPTNPRVHSKKQIRQIARSIELFGFNVPLLVDRRFKLVAGHGRLAACQLLGMSDVPVISLEHLTEEEVAAYRLVDNKLTDNSVWDDRLLAESLKLLSGMNLDFELEATGFEMAEIDLRLEWLETEEGRGDQLEEAVEPSSGPAVSKVGDVWELGDSRVLCGDALDPDSYKQLMPGQRASLVITDPPYNVPIQGHVGGLGAVQHREFAMASGEMSSAEFAQFLERVLRNAVASTEPGAVAFIFMDWRHVEEVLAAAKAAGAVLLNICVWVKDNGGMGSLYRSQHELVFVFKNGSDPHRNNVQLGKHGRYRTNVWRYAGMNSFARKGEEGDLLELHPTVKPVQLVADAILDCSARGDIVLDPFLGSGTTVIAAVRTGRRCYGIEYDPLYVDTIIRRWQAFTGGKAVHAESGKAFDDFAAEVSHAG